jgi:predicted lipoprotein
VNESSAGRTAIIRRAALWVVVVIAVGAAMVWDTTFLDPEAAIVVGVAEFSPEEFAEVTFPQLTELYAETAVDVAEVGAALREDPDNAGERFGIDVGSGRFGYALEARGEAVEVDEDFITIAIDDNPDLVVRVPLTTAINGSPIRDASGTIAFGDFRDQTEFQEVANQFRRLMIRDVIDPLDLTAIEGQQVRVVGAWLQGGPPDTFLIQPVLVEVNP